MSSRNDVPQQMRAVKRAISQLRACRKAPIRLKLSVMGQASSSRYQADEHCSCRLGFCGDSVLKGTHICLFYEDVSERDEIMFEYLRAGILDDERCYCMFYNQQPLNWVNHAYERGIDLEAALARNQVTVADACQFYLPEGTFFSDGVIARAHAVTKTAIQEGYSTFRVCSEVSWVADRKQDQREVLMFEQKLDRDYFHNNPSVVVCIYDMKTLSDAFLDDILTAHPYYVYKGVFKTNPCYSPIDQAV